MALALAIVATVTGAVACGRACGEPAAKPDAAGVPIAVATITRRDGTVSLERPPAARRPALSEAVYENDLVATGAASRAVLRSGAFEVELGEDTEFRLGPTLQRLSVAFGEVSFSSEAPEGAFLDTPFGRARVPRGSKASLSEADGGVYLAVSFGEVEFLDGPARNTSLSPGSRLRLSFGAVEFLGLDGGGAQPDAGASGAGAPGGVTARPLRGAPLVQSPGSKRFVPLPRGGSAIDAGTAFRLPPGAALGLASGPVSADLDGASAGVIESGTDETGAPLLRLRAPSVSGAVRIGATGGLEIADGDRRLQLRGAGASAELSVGRRERRVSVTIGELALQVGDEAPKTIGPNEVATVDARGRVKVAARPAPPVVASAGRQTRVLGAGYGAVALGLPPGGPHRVEVATDRNFRDVVLAGLAKDFVVAKAPSGGQLFWRVLPASPQGPQAEPAQPASVGRVAFLPALVAARNTAARSDVVAETGQKATVFFQSRVPSISFTYPASDGAKSYRFRVFKEEDLKRPVIDRSVDDTRAVVESGLLPEGEYLWHASALGAEGRERGGGRMNRLRIVFDNSLTTLLIESPADGERARTGLVAAGVAPLSTKLLTVNGRAARLDPGGRFSVPLGGASTVVFRLVDKSDVDSYWVRQLRR